MDMEPAPGSPVAGHGRMVVRDAPRRAIELKRVRQRIARSARSGEARSDAFLLGSCAPGGHRGVADAYEAKTKKRSSARENAKGAPIRGAPIVGTTCGD